MVSKLYILLVVSIISFVDAKSVVSEFDLQENGEANNPTGRTCYQTETAHTATNKVCSEFMDKCMTVSYDMTMEGIPTMPVTAYQCANDEICKDPANFCEMMEENIPFKVENCAIQCCDGNGCNNPAMKGQELDHDIH